MAGKGVLLTVSPERQLLARSTLVGGKKRPYLSISLHSQALHPNCKNLLKRQKLGESSTRRHETAVLATQTPQEEAGKEDPGAFTALYERETPLVSVLLEEIDKEGYVYTDTSGSSKSAELAAEGKKEVIRTVVERHFGDMSQGLLMVLAGYAQAAYSKGQKHVAETLEMIREEILRMSVDQMPVEMQVLDELVAMMGEPKEDRIKLMLAVSEEAAQDAENNGSTPTSLGSLRTTATQMLEDMESHDIVIDRRLLVRLCLVREDIDEAAKQLQEAEAVSLYHDMMTTSFRLLPMGNAAYIKEVLGVPNPDKRRALLEMCFRNDFNTEKESQLLKKWKQQGVRPGRLMNTIKALLVALEERGVPPDSPERARLLEIQSAAVNILKSLMD